MSAIAARGEAERKRQVNVVRAAVRGATNRPPRACRLIFEVIIEYADWQTGRNGYPGVFPLMGRDGCGLRQAREKLRRLQDGHFIDVQLDGPDPGPGRAKYLQRYPDPRHRPAVYRVVMETLSAAPGSIAHDGKFPWCKRCHPEATAQRLGVKTCGNRTSNDAVKTCGNGTVRRAETDTQDVRLAARIPSEKLHHPKTPQPPTAGAEANINNEAPQQSPGPSPSPSSSPEVERATETLLLHLLRVVQEVMQQTSTPAGDRAALVSLRALLFPEGKVDDFDEMGDDPVSDRLDEILTVARWTTERGDGDGKGKPFVLGKYQKLAVLFDPAEFPAALSQAHAWEDGRKDWQKRNKELFAIEKPLETEWKVIRHMLDDGSDSVAGNDTS